MAHIKLNNEDLPGIVGLMDYSQETAKPLRELAEILLRGNSSLTSGEREIIAASVSYKNDCHFCHSSHAAAAMAHLNVSIDLIDDIKDGLNKFEISPKLRALLKIAHKVQISGKSVQIEDIEIAKGFGANEKEIHDTVLIAAAFCMFNRYVDGLGTLSPKENEAYIQMGQRMAHTGYIRQ